MSKPMKLDDFHTHDLRGGTVDCFNYNSVEGASKCTFCLS